MNAVGLLLNFLQRLSSTDALPLFSCTFSWGLDKVGNRLDRFFNLVLIQWNKTNYGLVYYQSPGWGQGIFSLVFSCILMRVLKASLLILEWDDFEFGNIEVLLDSWIGKLRVMCASCFCTDTVGVHTMWVCTLYVCMLCTGHVEEERKERKLNNLSYFTQVCWVNEGEKVCITSPKHSSNS